VIRPTILELVGRRLLAHRADPGPPAPDGPGAPTPVLTSLFDELAATNQNPTSILLTHEIGPAHEHVAAALGATSNAPVIHRLRLRYAGNRPLAIMENYLPADSSTSGRPTWPRRVCIGRCATRASC
jgi:UTRA domain